MANNTHVNKVVFGSATLVDLTGTTATADKILQGYGAFGADGSWMDGTAVAGGGGGLEYETGTFSPEADIDRPTIQWTNTHTEAPIFVLFSDQTGTAHSATNSMYNWMYCDFYKLWGHGIPYTSSEFRYAAVYFSYRASSTSSISSTASICSNNSDSTSSSSTTYPRYWVSPIDFHPYGNSTSRYWRAGRTYKWIAVWKP